VADTSGKGARGALPAEAIEVERVVGLFDFERGSGVLWSVEEFNDFAPRAFTVAEIQRVRALRGALFTALVGRDAGPKTGTAVRGPFSGIVLRGCLAFPSGL